VGCREMIMGRRAGVRLFVGLACAGLMTSCVGHPAPAPPSSRPAATGVSTGTPRSSASASGPTTPASHIAPVFAMYYLWWDRQHWTSRLGRDYPLTGADQPLPASLDASGCATRTGYRGNVETDISPGLAYNQSNPAVISEDLRQAAATGLTGFAVNWAGTGAPGQSASSTALNTRLNDVFAAAQRLNSAGTPFKIILNYQSSARRLTTSQFINDLDYFVSTYGNNPVLDHSFSPLPEVIMAGTWKYTDADLATISRALRGRLYLIGDEKPSSWDDARAKYLDGTSYYWSSQNPITNPSSFETLRKFAELVRTTPNPDGRPKTWLAPFTPGYNAMLRYHSTTCVPRDDGRTMHALFEGNAESHPDGWTLISWNEITEGTYVVPLKRYGMNYLRELKSILRPHR
jgi:hypothetical protein